MCASLCIALSITLPIQSVAFSESALLKYDEPGQIEPLSEGLPIGNGSLGALIMGKTAEERIVLNKIFGGSELRLSLRKEER